jgi:cytoskeletal protein CcmA (bactofilin family)
MAEQNGEYPTIIGQDAIIKGELRFEKGVRLLGQFDGEIETKGNLLIAEGARLSGEVKAGNVRLDGSMAGNLEASGKVQLSASAKLEGDLRTARLEVADGATFVGRVAVGPQQNGKAPASAPGAAAPAAAGPTDRPERTKPMPEPVAAGKR